MNLLSINSSTWLAVTDFFYITLNKKKGFIAIPLSLTPTHLYLFVPEGEEEPLAVLAPEPVDAPGVDGPGQVVVDLLLRVPLLLLAAGSYPNP